MMKIEISKTNEIVIRLGKCWLKVTGAYSPYDGGSVKWDIKLSQKAPIMKDGRTLAPTDAISVTTQEV